MVRPMGDSRGESGMSLEGEEWYLGAIVRDKGSL